MRLTFPLLLTTLIITLSACNLEEIPDGPADGGVWECGKPYTDPRDGKQYKTIWIANDGSHDPAKPGACWMAEDFKFNTANFFSNCYDGQAANCDTYGRLYHKQTLPTLVPAGWHIATADEWKQLFKTYGLTESLTGNGPIYSGNLAPFLPGGSSKLDILFGGSCSNQTTCDEIGQFANYWAATDGESYTYFNKNGGTGVWATAVIVGAADLRFYVRCVKN